MKETMKQHLHAAERKIIQNMIRREYDGWPPQSAAFFTSPTDRRESPRQPNPRPPASDPILAAAPSPPRFRTQNEP